jgi:hypothetical protein
MRPSSVKAMAFAFLVVLSFTIALPPAVHAATRNQTSEPQIVRDRGEDAVRALKRLLARLFGPGKIVSTEHPVVPHP